VHAAAPPISEVIGALQRKVAEGEAYHRINYRSEALTLRDIVIDDTNKLAILLITHADPSAPNAVYADIHRKTAEVIRKKPNEANEYGAHVIVSLAEEPHRPHTYLALIERVPTVGRALINRLLNAVINKICTQDESTFQCADQAGQRLPNGATKTVSYRPILSFSGHPSDDFIRDLEEGTLNGLMLYHAEEQVQLGRSPYLTKSETSLKVSVDRRRLTSNLWANLKETLFGESEKWEKARIRFTNNKGRPASVSIASVSGNILDDSYVRTVNIRDINPHLDNSSTHIVQHLADKMIEELFVYRGDKASPQMEPKRKAYA
jgi:hypothetical protein